MRPAESGKLQKSGPLATKGMGLLRRSIVSVNYNILSNIAKIGVLFVQSVLLARWLEVDTFGVYAGASVVVAITSILPVFGMKDAFLHRAPETEDEDQAAAVHLTLNLIFTAIWAVALAATSLLLDEELRRPLLLIIAMGALTKIGLTPRIILVRRVVHRRLALLDIISTTLAALTAIFLAWQGAEIWALLATNVVNAFVTIVMLYLWRPVWRPHLGWDPAAVRYFLRYGSRNLGASVLQRALDQFDDLWTSLFLGKTALGFYSRAYKFATYPRLILASPINDVAGGTYAELKNQRTQLSKAFFRTNALLIRTGFLLGGWLALIAPEFIRIFIGAKWLPMLDAFRLMLVFTLFDPIKITVGSLFLALGKPEVVLRARLFQLLIMIAALFILGPRYDIAGVAVAVDIMLVVGIGILLWLAKKYVRFSITRLLVPPTLALIPAMGLARAAILLPGVLGAPWRTGVVKSVVFLAVYGTILLILEQQALRETVIPMIRPALAGRLNLPSKADRA